MSRKLTLLFILLIYFGNACSRESTYPDLRDSHDPEFQAELDAALSMAGYSRLGILHRRNFL